MSDLPHLKAEAIIEHHHWVWTSLLAAKPVTVTREEELCRSS